MYTVSIEQKQYKTYVLSDKSAGSQIEVVPERGGIVTSWRINGQEVFYLDTERFTHPDLSVRGGNPILFPLCGNLPNDTYDIDGIDYKIKQHGFARESAWSAVGQQTDDAASVTIELVSNEKTKAVYPFDFHLAFTYVLKGNTLEIHQEYKNLSSTPMPFSSGFHPYFLCGDKNQIEAHIPSVRYEDNRTKENFAFDGKFDFDQDEIDSVFGNLSSRSTSIIDRDRNLKIAINYDDFYTYLVFWTVKGKDFYCLEPWSATRNALNTKEYLTVLEPNASCKAVVSITAEFF
ncbi:aldose epimerase [Pseudanabaena sp. 'Roaring Creek']|uniref:aldose epimerase family protein n=1 Tax=Pseudanabaena sp. 'Roaring Creek' TaxID=1681830 RepID=UPI0006D7D3A4|nr:aldose epimerase [Pseudanabaena sp. 'Roaring Creek']